MFLFLKVFKCWSCCDIYVVYVERDNKNNNDSSTCIITSVRETWSRLKRFLKDTHNIQCYRELTVSAAPVNEAENG